MIAAASRQLVLDDHAGYQILAEVEERLARRPHACFDVRVDATIDVVCEAFAALADRCHPARFSATSTGMQHRAFCCFRALREAFWGLAATRLRPYDDRVTQRFQRVR
jgi:hypothetical protein